MPNYKTYRKKITRGNLYNFGIGRYFELKKSLILKEKS